MEQLLFDRANHPHPAILNGTVYVPAHNGTLVNILDCTNNICPAKYGEVRYIPTFAGNLTYLIIFTIFLLAQIGLGIRYRTWGFLVGMIGGLVLEVVGYVGRLLMSANDFVFNYFVIYLVCLTIGPAFITASIYLCLSRLVVVYGTHIARFSPKTYTITFVCCDILSLVLQATGGGLAATANNNSNGEQTGVNVMIAGLAFQVFSLTLFMVLGLDFAWAVRKAGKSATEEAEELEVLRGRLWFRLFPYALALATITIYIRCCYRVAELEHGFNGALANNQTIFMIFEGPMIMVAALCLTVWHPGFAFGGVQGWKAANWTWKQRAVVEKSVSGEDLNEAKWECRNGHAHGEDVRCMCCRGN